MSFSTDSVDYVQRRGPLPERIALAGTGGAPATRRLLHVRGIGRRDKRAVASRVGDNGAWRPHTAELITGLFGYRIPIAFSIAGDPAGVTVQLGTWSARGQDAGVQDRRLGVISSVLRGLYPVVDTQAGDHAAAPLPLSGMALGIPAPTPLDESDGSAPVDRLIRAMAGTTWAALVLAYPVAETAVATMRGELLNEVRAVESAAQSEGAPSPLADQYVGLLERQLAHLAEALATGAWRTAAYLLGDEESYPRLATAWRSVFSSERSLPEPARVFDRTEAGQLARDWTLSDEPVAPGPSRYQRPFELQTLLTASLLASYVHLPEIETPGFAIDSAPRFDAVPPTPPAEGGVAIGRVLHQRRDTGSDYVVSLRSLTRHAFVAGLTGSGKTNTIFSLLDAADHEGIPFLVVEPAKTEYRALLGHPRLGSRLRVFTAGRAGVSPFLLNPFEVPAGTAVSEHIDLVRAAFAAGFGMWTPLPQLLERCLHGVYADRGWDLRTNSNVRLPTDADKADAFPTLTDLVAKVHEVLPTLGYEDRIAGDLRAALVTRLEALRIGGKGAMLDISQSLPIEELLAHPTVIELEAMGDEGDKAFLMALVLIRLAEHRRTAGQSPDLRHILVVEEAHRLLGNVSPRGSPENADPRGQAVETFSNLLSEIRAYGQGMIVADQVPVRLAPDVIKNTNLKIAHRIVSADDRAVLAGAMAMEEAQSAALTTLGVGDAAVFSTGDDQPLLVRVPLAKDGVTGVPPPDADVAARMTAWRSAAGLDALVLPRPSCSETCAGEPEACETARRLTADESATRTLARLCLSVVEDAGALDRLWDELTGVLAARRPPGVSERALLRAFAGHGADWYAQRRGAQSRWSYADTRTVGDRLRAALLDRVEGGDAQRSAALREDFRAAVRALYRRDFEPYPVCRNVCEQDPAVCLYRAAVSDLVASRRYHPAWSAADATDAAAPDRRRKETWEVCQDAAFELIEFPDPDASPDLEDRLKASARRVCLCFEQQMLANDDRKLPRTARRILARVMGEAGL